MLTPRIEFSEAGVRDSLLSDECPTCERKKNPKIPLCITCYTRLPFDTRVLLKRAWEAKELGPYIEALTEATRRLTDEIEDDDP